MANKQPTTRNTLEQGRAKHAYLMAKEVVDKHSKKKTEYKQLAKKLPMYIKNNGLGAALAFIKSKANTKDNGTNEHHLIYDHITQWLKKHDTKQMIEEWRDDDLVASVIHLESQEYRALTVEVLAYLNWLRRFADGLIEKDKTT